MDPVVRGRLEVGIGESFGGADMALVVIESTAILAPNGPRVDNDRAIVIGDQIEWGNQQFALVARRRSPPAASGFRPSEREGERMKRNDGGYWLLLSEGAFHMR
ncbi:hypothetical protein SESBI_28676 [Sesbania bispinosa]|nr:hypothetical protein SESBI_28676 [Sesbania bispinosa]